MPREACGLLLGTDSGERVHVRSATLGVNLATRDDRFALAPAAFLQALDLAQASACSLVGVWHSHVWSDAVPSAADLDGAWTELVQVIVGPVRTPACAITAWAVANGEAVRMQIAGGRIRRPGIARVGRPRRTGVARRCR